MLTKITYKGVTTVVDTESLSATVVKVTHNGMLLDLENFQPSISEATIDDLNSLTYIDKKYGEVAINAIRIR